MTETVNDDLTKVRKWHARLGHPSLACMTEVNKEFQLSLDAQAMNNMGFCPVCVKAKAIRAAFHRHADSQYKAIRILGTLCSDLAVVSTAGNGKRKRSKEPICPTLDGHKYALVVIDEYSHSVFVRLLHKKSDAKPAIIALVKWLQGRTGYIVERFHSDGGGEFIDQELLNFFNQNGTRITRTTTDTPQRNGMAERMNRTLFEIVRSLMVQADAPQSLWGEALKHAEHIYNSTPHPVIGNSIPLRVLINRRFNVQKMKVWGCDAYVTLLPSQQSKVQAKTWTGVFIGYCSETDACRILNPRTRAIVTSLHVTFDEESFAEMKKIKGSRSQINFKHINPFNENENIDDAQLFESSAMDDDGGRSAYISDNESNAVDPEVDPSADVEVVSVPESHISSMDSDVINDESIARNQPMEVMESAPSLSNDEDEKTNNPSFLNEEDENQLPSPPISIDDDERSVVEESFDEDDEQNDNVDNMERNAREERNGHDDEHIEAENEISRESRLLLGQYGSWNPRSAPAGTDLSRYGRVRSLPNRLIASNPLNYHPSDIHHALTERVHSRLQRERTQHISNQDIETEFANLFIQVDHDQDYVFSAIIPTAEPAQYKDAMKTPEADEWKVAMQEEYNSLVKLGVWSIVDCPKGVKPLKGRWVFKNKLGDKNQLIRRKARFVVKGYLQVPGRDYNETHAPVAKMKSVKLLLSLTAHRDLELHQLDFDTAFLNAPVEEDIYVEQPEGFHRGRNNQVLKLIKALYGLKQAPRQWNKTIDQFMHKLGYRALRSDPCVYTKLTRSNKLMILSLYVDDTVIAFHRDDLEEWTQDKTAISAAYAIKDLGECNWILNMKVIRDRNSRTITLSQQAYIERIAKQLGVDDGRTVTTPLDTNNLYSPKDGGDPVPLDENKAALYRSIVGALLYAANITRIDIAYAVGQLCRHTANPCTHHIEAARRVLRYVRDTPELCLIFGRNKSNFSDCRLDVYCDADWGSDRYDGKSNTGCVVRFNGDVMNWVSKKQSSVAMSSAEAEYMAMAEAVKEALWYRSWISEVFDRDVCANIHCDNQAAIKLSGNDTIHDRSKHIRLRYHFIRDEVEKKHVTIHWIKSAKQQADILTKALDKLPFERLREKLLNNPNGKCMPVGEC